MATDFRRGLSYKALFMSIVSQISGYEFGKNENGLWVFQPLQEDQKTTGLYKSICAGFIKWIIREAAEYKETNKFENEQKDFLNCVDGMKRLKEIIKSLAISKMLKDKSFRAEQLEKWVVKKANELDFSDVEKDALKILARQSLPVRFNKALVRTYYYVKQMLREIKTRNVKSIEGLAFIDLIGSPEEKKRFIDRMDAVSSGVFAGVNMLYAIPKGFVGGGGELNCIEAAANINFVNLFDFVTVIRADAQNIVKDILGALNERAANTEAQYESYDRALLEKVIGLNKVETSILYSLELQQVKKDIQKTRSSDIQIRKNKWAEEWKTASIEGFGFSKLFQENENKLYAAIQTNAANQGRYDWLYRIVLELAQFKPYTPLSDEKEKVKEYKNLKPTNYSYLKEDFCAKQTLIDEKEINGLLKTYNKQYGYISDKGAKTAVGVVGAVAVTAATAGTAFVFAPSIAVALVGNLFGGLYGAALTNASLALLGGGAIAAGGLGMAGGTLVIAGGGALVGLGASGMTATAFMLLASPEYVQMDYAKLLTNCEYVLLGKYNMYAEVNEIRSMIQDDLNKLKVKTMLAEQKLESGQISASDKNNAKEMLKSIGESQKVIEKTIKALDVMLKKH